MLKVISFNK